MTPGWTDASAVVRLSPEGQFRETVLAPTTDRDVGAASALLDVEIKAVPIIVTTSSEPDISRLMAKILSFEDWSRQINQARGVLLLKPLSRPSYATGADRGLI
jgi:hypothetical protein